MNELTLPLRNLWGRPIRTGLTTLGIAVAIAGFVALTGLTRGVEHSYSAGMEESGADLVVTQKNVFSLMSSSVPETLGPTLAAVAGVEAVSATLLSITTVDDAANIVIAAWPRRSFLWQTVELGEGRLPDDGENWEVVLGRTIAEALGKSVGDTVELQFQPYRIVGIAAFATVLNQNIAMVPLEGLQELIGRQGAVTLYQVRLARPVDATGIAAVKARLSEAAVDYEVSVTSEFASNIRLISLFQAIASTISLVVLAMASIGVANTLLMAVNERTYEIGILAALGWRPGRILRLILIEGLVMSLLGGAIGIGLGIAVMHLASRSHFAAGLMEPYLSASVVVEALISVLVAGPLGALYPAWRATRIVPAEALRMT
ncbi:MAG: ABC transporter permease [Bauldia sp.]